MFGGMFYKDQICAYKQKRYLFVLHKFPALYQNTFLPWGDGCENIYEKKGEKSGETLYRREVELVSKITFIFNFHVPAEISVWNLPIRTSDTFEFCCQEKYFYFFKGAFAFIWKNFRRGPLTMSLCILNIRHILFC